MALWLAAQQHHDALLRELVLYRVSYPLAPGAEASDLSAAEDAEAVLAEAITTALDEADESAPTIVLPPSHPSPLPRVVSSVDVSFPIDADLIAAFAALQDSLDEAEELAAQGRMLARPGLPEIVAVRDWCCEQAIAQADGVPGSSWGGSDQDRFTRTSADRFSASLPIWDAEPVISSEACIVAADDNDRLIAVSRPAAELVGWDVDELTGRRVVTLIPPRLREAHVAGFTRHLTTGQAHVLGVELDLPVLRADGTEITCRFLIDKAPATRGGAVYLAKLTPLPL